MAANNMATALDKISLIIIGIGASLFCYYLEKSLATNQSLCSIVTIALILLISVFTQFLVNGINRSRKDLRLSNENLEQKVIDQPIVALKTRSVVGFEALIRRNHPQLGLIYPGSFISIAEETGLIIPITRLMIERAFSDFKIWQERIRLVQKLTKAISNQLYPVSK